MANLTSALKHLARERNRLVAQVERLDHVLSVLNRTGAHQKRRLMSPAARRRIVAAQKARWAKWRKAHNRA